MKPDRYFKSKMDIAEDIVYNWYSLVRGMHFTDRVVIPALQIGICYKLMNVTKMDLKQAEQFAIQIIKSWTSKCADMAWGDPDVMLSLVNEIESVLQNIVLK